MTRELLENQIYNYLCAQLRGHQLEIGAHLTAGDIAEELDVSRTSVRKAIMRMVDDGCVQLNDGGRPIVVSLPKKRKQPQEAVFVYANQTEQAYWAIFNQIFEGKLRAGESVNGQELAESIGVSLGTIRQALDWLCRDGLLSRLPRRGWEVVHLEIKDMIDAFKIRLLLETEAMSRAIKTISREQLEKLIAESERVISAGMQLKEEQRRNVDYHFHQTLLDASDSSILQHAVDPMIRKCMLTGVPFDTPMEVVTTTFSEHIEIAKALLEHNLPKAREILEVHLMRSMHMYEKLRSDEERKKPAAKAD